MAQTQFNTFDPQLDPVSGRQAQEPRVFAHDAVGIVVGAINNSDANHGITVTSGGTGGANPYIAGDTITLTNPNSVVTGLVASITTPFTAATDGTYLCTATGGATVDNVTTTGTGTGLTFNLTISGGVTTAIDILTAGSGYVVGNTITLAQARFGGAVDEVITLDADNFLEAIVTVDEVDAAGLVTKYRVTTVGAGYFVGDSLTQASTTSAAGTGFTCDVSNIDIPNTQKRGCCLYVGASAGLTSLTAVMESGNTATFRTVSAGTILPILVKRITTALDTNDVIALY